MSFISRTLTLFSRHLHGLRSPIKNVAQRKISNLSTVGKLQSIKLEGNYDTGQMFLHKVFGYRGVILFPWMARVFDRDMPSKAHGTENPTFNAPIGGVVDKADVKGRTQTYYQVLIDGRDTPYITNMEQTESVTFLGSHSENSRDMCAIPGVDHLAHEDILPYTTSEANPLQHELFDKFLMYQEGKDPPFVAQDILRAWQEKNHPLLDMSDVHKETTENIRVTVIPFYMGYRQGENQQNTVFFWRYCIRLENLGEATVQLRERNWRIFSPSGTETVKGRGVVGQEPVLSRQQPAFQYSSYMSLQAPSGHMWGTFKMEREDGHVFDCRIPQFNLESKQEDTWDLYIT